MRVMILGNISIFNRGDYGWGGIETTLKAFRKYLSEAGHEVKVVNLVLVPKAFEKEIGERDPNVIYLDNLHPIKRLWPAYFIKKQLGHILDEFRPDVVWSRNVQLGLAAGSLVQCPVFQIFPELAHIAYLWDFPKASKTFSDKDFNFKTWILWSLRRFRRFPRYLWERWLEGKAVRELGLVVFSMNMKEQIQKVYGAPEEVVHLVHPGVDENIFNVQKGLDQMGEIEKRFGLRRSENIILFVGRLVAGKNMGFLLKALALTTSKNRLVIVGDGPLREELERACREMGLAERVIFVGRQDEYLPGFYALARVFVNPCFIEPFGHVFIESLVCGTPVIGIRSDGSRTITALDEVTGGGKYGKAVEPSPEALAKAIEEMVSLNEDHYRLMSEEGTRFVRKNYDWREFIKTMTNLKARP